MKRINLVPKERFFPISEGVQRNVIYPLIFLIILFYGYNFYRSKKELDLLNLTIFNLKNEIENIKKTILEKNQYLEKSSVIEKEFLTIHEDYNVLKKDMRIKDIFEKLTEIVPHNLWITSISYSNLQQKSIYIDGKSYDKESIFIFLNNCIEIGKNPELINIDKEEKSVYRFNIKIEGI